MVRVTHTQDGMLTHTQDAMCYTHTGWYELRTHTHDTIYRSADAYGLHTHTWVTDTQTTQDTVPQTHVVSRV